MHLPKVILFCFVFLMDGKEPKTNMVAIKSDYSFTPVYIHLYWHVSLATNSIYLS